MAVTPIGLGLDDILKEDEPMTAEQGVMVEYIGPTKKAGNPMFVTKTGKPCLYLKFKVVDHPEQTGKELLYMATIGEFTLSDFAKVIPEPFSDAGFDDEAGVGAVVKVNVEVKEVNGKPRNNIKFVERVN